MTIIDFNVENLFDYLENQTIPVMEATLINELYSDDVCENSFDELFRIHFSLFHSLYKLKHSAGAKGYYLHLDPMRIRMLRIPDNYFCHHYFDIQGLYCEDNTQEGTYCKRHMPLHEEEKNSLSFDPLYDFYMNADNIIYANDTHLQKMMDGILSYAYRKGEIDCAMKLFGITHIDKDKIKKKYYELAKKLHPDIRNNNEEDMKNLNKSYSILQEVFGF